MQKLFLFVFVISVLFVSSCSDDSSNGGGIGPGGGGGNISFAITGQVDPGNPANYIFAFQPSVDTKLSKLVVGLPAQPFSDTINNTNNPNYIFSKDTAYSLDPYTGIQTGQAWTFAFTGNIVSDNTAYTTTSNFTIP